MTAMRSYVDKNLYIDFINKVQPHVFASSWWLDAVTSGNWDALVVEQDGVIVAGIPFHVKNFYGLKYIGMPELTQKLGPIILFPENISESKKVSFEIKVYKIIADTLPKYGYFNQNFDHSVKNWLPFYWAGYQQTTRYTYVIHNLKDVDAVVSNIAYSKKKQIKKAEESLVLRCDLTVTDFYYHLKKSLAYRNIKISYSLNLFKKIYDDAYRNHSGKSFYVQNTDGKILAVLFLIWDSDCAYALISSIDYESNKFGASSFLFKEVILFASKICNKFDFEGSMSESIEHSFRQFGGVQTPYFSIKKYTGLYNVLKFLS